jgi:hypothetical protein
MCLNQILQTASALFVVIGTYLLSRQLFIEIVVEQFKRNLLNYKKYQDVPIYFRLAGLFYNFTKENWINADTGIGSERPINKLKLSNPVAPFNGFLCICIAAVLQIIAIFY